MFDRSSRKEVTLEASREVAKPKTMLKPRKVKSPHRNCWLSHKVTSTYYFLKCSGVLRWKEEKGRNLRRLPRLQQEDSSHSLASSGETWGQQFIIVIDPFSHPNILLLIFPETQMFCYWWFLKHKYCRRTLSLSRPRTISSSSRFWLSSALLKMKNSGLVCYFPIFRRIISVCGNVSPP